MSKKLFIILLLLLTIVNLISMVVMALKKDNPGKREKAKGTRQLALLSILGGGLGTLIGFLLFPLQRTNKRFRNALIGALVWAVITLGAGIFLFTHEIEFPDETTIASVEPDTSSTETVTTEEPSSSEEESTRDPNEPLRIKLVAIGDMLMHDPVNTPAIQPDGSYDYSFLFEPILDDIREADIAVVNNEIPFGGDEYGPRSYPRFNAMTALGDAEVEAGFNVILHASNHVLDMDIPGLMNTIEFWKKYPEVKVLGIHESQEHQDQLQIIEIEGVKIALYNCTYLINRYETTPEDQPYLVDMMTQDSMGRMKEMIMRAEEEADFTIVFPHWGIEYQIPEDQEEHYFASFFTLWGADLIIGTHTHVIGPQIPMRSNNGNTSYVYYCLGNYVSAQERTVCLLGEMAKVTLLVDETGVHIEDHDTQYLVTHYDSGFTNLHVVKLEDYTEEMAAKHGIIVDGLNETGSNVQYPFGLKSFQDIIEISHTTTY